MDGSRLRRVHGVALIGRAGDRRLGRPVRRQASSTAAVALSFLWPGLGHWFRGRRRSALLFASPFLGVALVISIQGAGGLGRLALTLIAPSSALTMAILVTLLGLWRIAAMADSMLEPRTSGQALSVTATALFLVLTAATVGVHGYAGHVAWAIYDAGSKVFVAEHGADLGTDPNLAGSQAVGDIAHAPEAPLGGGRITVLVTSFDSEDSPLDEITDTLIILSVEPATNSAVLLSIPGELSFVPLPDGTLYARPVNTLYAHAAMNPAAFPEGPLGTLAGSISQLIGIPIDYHAAVDTAGFRDLIDALGGLRIDVAAAIDDPDYEWLDGSRGFTLSAGPHVLDGDTALAYVRSHTPSGDDALDRSRRQQAVLVALRSQFATPETLPALPRLIEQAGMVIRTNLPPDLAADLIDRAQDPHGALRQVVLATPYTNELPGDDGAPRWLRLEEGRMAALSIELFGSSSHYAFQ